MLRSYRRALDQARTAPLRVELSWLGGVLGVARDAEVRAERFAGYAQSAERASENAAEYAANATTEKRAERAAARAAMQAGCVGSAGHDLSNAPDGPQAHLVFANNSHY